MIHVVNVSENIIYKYTNLGLSLFKRVRISLFAQQKNNHNKTYTLSRMNGNNLFNDLLEFGFTEDQILDALSTRSFSSIEEAVEHIVGVAEKQSEKEVESVLEQINTASTTDGQLNRKRVVLCFGDSWAFLGANALKNKVNRHHPSVQVVGYGVSGSTAKQWAQNKNQLVSYLRTHGGDSSNRSSQQQQQVLVDQLVWLSIGGNDISHYFMQGVQDVDLGMRMIRNDIETILDALLGHCNKLKIVHFGYDFMNIEPMFLGLVGKTVTDANYIILALNEMIEQLTQLEKYKNRFFYVNIAGELQKAAGIEGAPRLDLPSPRQFMQDFIHPNASGFSVLMDKLYENYLKKELTNE